jgi:hypothetical protein
MSALGQKRTLRFINPMSALSPKADIGERNWDVRFVPKVDSCTAANSMDIRPPRLREQLSGYLQVNQG